MVRSSGGYTAGSNRPSAPVARFDDNDPRQMLLPNQQSIVSLIKSWVQVQMLLYILPHKDMFNVDSSNRHYHLGYEHVQNRRLLLQDQIHWVYFSQLWHSFTINDVSQLYDNLQQPYHNIDDYRLDSIIYMESGGCCQCVLCGYPGPPRVAIAKINHASCRHVNDIGCIGWMPPLLQWWSQFIQSLSIGTIRGYRIFHILQNISQLKIAMLLCLPINRSRPIGTLKMTN